ncbi:MAG: hypothetical protein CVT72_06835 [Alphaproteobacteria bacterium HGW-Alphaproteobacteria-11]|nr:MAG: hypothetical protein CVT72_06835 [Alphaproteobacteria bacterium HGW-Alphaproteobacteria-11]
MIRQTFTLLVLTLLAAGPALAQSAKFEPGTRSGPFVATDKSLTDLLGDGYRIRGNLGTALILQKGASVFSCQVPPDPEALDFKPYFVCAELSELPRAPDEAAPKPRTGN